ncbi:MAG: squalene synthase HpnC [Alphaproteobacteria bacterium]|nr:squalene synthase HpnC [Alphaproteobacteria bacterium]
MTTVAELQSGKGHRDENFPVASFLIRRRYRPVILAFYRFARAADDVADHPTASSAERLNLLQEMDRTLIGKIDAVPEALALRRVLEERKLSAEHALMLLEAFRRDVTKLRYQSWDEVMDYCRYSAMPVGRFVLDVHGESGDTWPANDALCAALQIINHLQDCGKDYRALGRVYLPEDALAAAGVTVKDLREDRASPALRRVIADLAGRTQKLLGESSPFADQIRDLRLSLEVAVIQRLAEGLARRLTQRDPLSERVHHSKSDLVPLLLEATARFLRTRVLGGKRTFALRSSA